jgi:heme exporter protein CcmD
MSALTDFVNMGGYGRYVWSAYGIWALVMIWIAASAHMRHSQVQRRLISRMRAEDMDS